MNSLMGTLRQVTRERGPRLRSRGSHGGGRVAAATVALSGLTASQAERWRELAATAVEANPFFEPEFMLPLAAAVPASGIALRVITSGSDWIGLLPIRRTSSWRRVPLSGTAGWKSSYTYLGAPLLRRDMAHEAARALLDSTVRGRHYLGLELLARDGGAGLALHRAADELGFATTPLRTYDRAALRRRPDPAQYVALKPKHRRELRRQRDRLAEELQCEVEPRDQTGSDAAVSEFLRIEGSGWKHASGTAFSSIDGHETMFREICRSFDAAGRLQLLTLSAGDRTLAAKCNLLAGDGAYCFKIAFDERWARFSPGVQLELANIDFFHRTTQLRWMDSCAEPGNEMINRLWPDRRAIEVTAITGTGSGKAAERVFRAAVQTRELIRKGDAS
jgi:CelD/BcsL family acetyltransferase involved in cellulose biosynthesis